MKARLAGLFTVLVLAGGLLLGAAFFTQPAWWAAAAAAAGTAFMLVAQKMRSSWLSGAGFLVLAGASGLAAWMGTSATAALASFCLNLAAWNLFAFIQRLGHPAADEVQSGVVNRYLAHLGGLALLSFAAGSAALSTRVLLTFPAAVLLAAAVFGGLAVAVRFLIFGSWLRASQDE